MKEVSFDSIIEVPQEVVTKFVQVFDEEDISKDEFETFVLVVVEKELDYLLGMDKLGESPESS